ncbi:hypothetical protein EI171_08330 [Bradyrhizobium sp. LCT2]|uniref:hypothetical protein n=1 Tax=Bradyrhizobium sp. LCT2 TaxID=2493093 RepID=UPI00137462E0|nr:hypothetical protein [Bradyrhizobium sp. LCT2]QHP67434.1 hypothetical protein EI171_08330 [Bradyrhizobium sp. LCT2]
MTAIHWKSGVGGNFDDASNWSTATVPSSSDDALIDASGTYTVESSLSRTVHSLTMAAGATLEIVIGDFDLDFFGTDTNNGTIHVYSDLAVFGALNNTGVIDFFGGPTPTFSPHVVGYFQPTGTSTNSGTIDAINDAEISFNIAPVNGPASFTNYGIIEALGGSIITIGGNFGATSSFTNVGTIEALGQGSSVDLFSTSGTITNSGHLVADGGTIQISNLDSISGSGTAEIRNGGTLFIGTSFSENTTFGAGANGILQLGIGASFTGTLSGFTTGDKIDFSGLQYSGSTLAFDPTNNALTVSNGVNAPTIHLSGSYVGGGFQLSADASGSAQVTYTPPSQSPVNLTDGNLVVEMAELANEAYGKSAAAAIGRNWHAVSATDLHLQPAGGVTFAFSDGVYDVTIPHGHADALVLEGLVDGVDTLAVAFKGTDDFGARINWPTPANYFSYFLPLISSLSDYISSHGIQHLLFAGHSLGGSMVQDALSLKYTGITAAKIDGYTWANPGSDSKPIDPHHLVNFEHTNDPALDLGRFVLGPRYGTDILIDSATESTSPFQTNSRSPVLLPSDNPAHKMDSYFLDTRLLAEHANDESGAFYGTPDAAALRTGAFWTAGVSRNQTIPGTNQEDNVTISSQDDFVLGGAGNDNFHWTMQTSAGSHPVVIDGGLGTDTLYLPGPQSLWYWRTIGTETDLYLKGSHDPIAIIYGVEHFHFAAGPPGDSTAKIDQPLQIAAATTLAELSNLHQTSTAGQSALGLGENALEVYASPPMTHGFQFADFHLLA